MFLQKYLLLRSRTHSECIVIGEWTFYTVNINHPTRSCTVYILSICGKGEKSAADGILLLAIQRRAINLLIQSAKSYTLPSLFNIIQTSATSYRLFCFARVIKQGDKSDSNQAWCETSWCFKALLGETLWSSEKYIFWRKSSRKVLSRLDINIWKALFSK
jgi:hypothetical protein